MAEFLTTVLNDGRVVLAKRDKFGVGAKTFANLTQARKAREVVTDPDLVVTISYGRPFYVVIRKLMDIFAEAHPCFQADIRGIAEDHGKSVEQVYRWWREYEASVSGEGGQSALLSEFQDWYAEKLEALHWLPITETRPELIRVVKRDGWYVVEGKHGPSWKWIVHAEYRTLAEAVKVADEWYLDRALDRACGECAALIHGVGCVGA